MPLKEALNSFFSPTSRGSGVDIYDGQADGDDEGAGNNT